MSELLNFNDILKYFKISQSGRVVIVLEDGLEIPIDILTDSDFLSIFGATKAELSKALEDSNGC